MDDNKKDSQQPGPACMNESWGEHMDDFKLREVKIDAMSSVMASMHDHTSNLLVLPSLVEAIRNMSDKTSVELQLLRQSLVGPATNRNFMPLSAVIPLIAAMSFCMMILGGVLLVKMSDDRAIAVDSSGIHIDRQIRHEQAVEKHDEHQAKEDGK
jgi:hypothetical protein